MWACLRPVLWRALADWLVPPSALHLGGGIRPGDRTVPPGDRRWR